jgi:RimJ/RimL family protein N-acetyltransferase
MGMVKFGFGLENLMPVHCIEALVSTDNISSIRLQEKLNFRQKASRA